ncbi:transposase [Streptomyces sp. NBC_01334]|uniref:transposase n=1 Tax=Streptomyces sp. NBC_01334 TaxID=2903827 RepID=UPI003FA3C828
MQRSSPCSGGRSRRYRAAPGGQADASSGGRRGLTIAPVECRVGRICRVSADLVSGDLWERVAPLLPARPPRRHRYPGRLPADDRAALRGIVYVLCKSVSWRDVPVDRLSCCRHVGSRVASGGEPGGAAGPADPCGRPVVGLRYLLRQGLCQVLRHLLREPSGRAVSPAGAGAPGAALRR